MTFISLTILFASFSYILYRSRFLSWLPARIAGREEEDSAIPPSASTTGEKGSVGGNDAQSPVSLNKSTTSPRSDVSADETRKPSQAHRASTTTTSSLERSETNPAQDIRPRAVSPDGDQGSKISSAKMSPYASGHSSHGMNGLMPPPPRPPPASSSPSSTKMTPSSSLRVPASGPVPNRNTRPATSSSASSLMPPPSAASLARGRPTTLKPSPATASTMPNPRKKVILEPGHSPIDWANLVRSSPNISGVPRMLRISPSQLALHNGRRNAPAWSAWQGKVYNIGPYLPYHPGGKGELLRAAGKSGDVVEKMFMEVHPWVNWDNMLASCVVGILVKEGEGDELVLVQDSKGNEQAFASELDDMD